MNAAISTNDAFAAQYAQLQRTYLAQLPAKVEEIHTLLHTVLAQPWDAEQGDKLHRMVHSIAGSGGTMGFQPVSDAARAMEVELKRVVHGEVTLDAVDATLRAGMARLTQSVANACLPVAAAAAPDMPANKLPPLHILVVDDDPDGQALLVTFLRADGHIVTHASDGEEGVARFKEDRPDMVLMDVVMPRMNGYEAARHIKAACGKQLVPLIFLTALQDDRDLVACIDAGGDDFIVKPYNRVLLRAKLMAMYRIREMHRELARYQQKTEEEIELSRYVFEAATNRNTETALVTHWHSSVGHFSGDLLLYARTATGRLFVLQGDFTGHGLAAALGALPLADTFYDMVEDDAALPELALSLNRKLKATLPVGHFCAACIVVLDPAGQQIEVWNGGLPGLWVLDRMGQLIGARASNKLPLGIVGDDGFDISTERIALQPGEKLLLFSDGLSEATNAAGDMLGDDGIAAMLQKSKGVDVVTVLRTGVEAHLAGGEAHDDISVVVIDPAADSAR